MRVAFFVLFGLLMVSTNLYAQYCPTGYEERNVKCGKEIKSTCVRINYSCSQCWAIKTPPCPGYKTGGTEYFNSYEKAYQTAEKNKQAALNARNYNCIGPDNRDYLIYLDDTKFCGSNNNSSNSQSNSSNVSGESDDKKNTKNGNDKNIFNSNANNNQTSSNSSDLQYQTEIQFFYVQHHNAEEKLETIKTNYPSSASIYESTYRPKLSQLLNNVKSESLKNNTTIEQIKNYRRQLDKLIEQMGNVERVELRNAKIKADQKSEYQKVANGYLLKAQDPNNSNILNQSNLDIAKLNAMMAGNSQQIEEIEEIQNQNDKKAKEELNKTFDNLTNLIEENERKKAEAKKRKFIEDQKIREYRIEEERKKQREQNEINENLSSMVKIDSAIISHYSLELRPSNISENVDSIYYIGYKRLYDKKEISAVEIKLFVVYRYSDGSFPLYSTIIEKSNFEDNINPTGISLLLGLFKSRNDVLKAVKDLEINALRFGLTTNVEKTIIELNQHTKISKGSKTDFWDQ